MSAARHIADRYETVHRVLGDVEPEADFVPTVCGGGIMAPGPRRGGPPTCPYCADGIVEPGWEQAP